MTETFASRAGRVLQRSLDKAPSGDPTSTRMLLMLFALRHLHEAGRGGATSWTEVRERVFHPTEEHEDARSLLLRAAAAVEGEHPVLRNVFTTDLEATGPGINLVLATWIAEVDAAWPDGEPVTDAGFGDWFDVAVDGMAARASSGLRASSTPRDVADLMVRLVATDSDGSAYDPCCGLGALLAAFERRDGEPRRPPELSGQEFDRGAAALARLRLFLKGGRDQRIVAGDTLRGPDLDRRGGLPRHDVVLCHPPFGQRLADAEFVGRDPHARFRHGAVGRSGTEFAFVQHGLASLAPKGRMAALLPLGPLSRTGADAAVRRNLLRADLVDAVVGLPPGVLPGTSVETAILVLDTAKRLRTRRVLFVDSTEREADGRSEWPRLADRIARAIRGAPEEAGFSTTVETAEIEARGFSLKPHAHVPSGRAPPASGGDPAGLFADAEAAEAEGRRLAVLFGAAVARLDEVTPMVGERTVRR